MCSIYSGWRKLTISRLRKYLVRKSFIFLFGKMPNLCLYCLSTSSWIWKTFCVSLGTDVEVDPTEEFAVRKVTVVLHRSGSWAVKELSDRRRRWLSVDGCCLWASEGRWSAEGRNP